MSNRAGSTRRNPIEQVETSYLGYPLLIRNRTITVLTPDRRHIAEVGAIQTARNCVKAYRRTPNG